MNKVGGYKPFKSPLPNIRLPPLSPTLTSTYKKFKGAGLGGGKKLTPNNMGNNMRFNFVSIILVILPYSANLWFKYIRTPF